MREHLAAIPLFRSACALLELANFASVGITLALSALFRGCHLNDGVLERLLVDCPSLALGLESALNLGILRREGLQFLLSGLQPLLESVLVGLGDG